MQGVKLKYVIRAISRLEEVDCAEKSLHRWFSPLDHSIEEFCAKYCVGFPTNSLRKKNSIRKIIYIETPFSTVAIEPGIGPPKILRE